LAKAIRIIRVEAAHLVSGDIDPVPFRRSGIGNAAAELAVAIQQRDGANARQF
jgi:hypothetical protein